VKSPADPGPRRLLIAAPRSLTDTLFMRPALAALAAAFTEAHLTLLSPLADEVAPLMPGVDEAWPEAVPWEADPSPASPLPQETARFVEQLAGRSFDAAAIFTDEGRSPHPLAYLCFLAGTADRWGVSREFAGAVLTGQSRAAGRVHAADRGWEVARAAGVRGAPPSPPLALPRSARQQARRLLGDLAGRRYLLVGLVPDDPRSTAMSILWEQVLGGLEHPCRPEQPAVVVALAGARTDLPLGAGDRPDLRIVRVKGHRYLATLAALAEGAESVLTYDGPLVPLAAALGRPVVAVFPDRRAARRRGGWGAASARTREVILPSDRAGRAARGRVLAAVRDATRAGEAPRG
jgi:ADP-heptose:LPS heptosyltransferase